MKTLGKRKVLVDVTSRKSNKIKFRLILVRAQDKATKVERLIQVLNLYQVLQKWIWDKHSLIEMH